MPFSAANSTRSCIIAIAVLRIASTYGVFNHTIDEPNLIACGLEWLTQHTYTYIPEQPPLSHIPVAVGAWLAGAHGISKTELDNQRSPYILYDSPLYYRTLASARAGTLPFFILAAVVVWSWARRLHGNLAAIFAVLLFTTLPPVLAHAALATTDMAACATYAAAVYMFIRWLDSPAYKQAVLFGLAVAGGILSKFCFFLFFPVSVIVILIVKGNWRQYGQFRLYRLWSLTLAGALCILTVWVVNWFSFEPLRWGILAVRAHNQMGHLSYLFGELRTSGWWYFFPVILAYKTPLALLPLSLLSCIWLRKAPREHWIPLACTLALLVSVLPTRLNLGVRHILPIYPLLAISAGLAVARSIQSASLPARIFGGFLVLWQLVSSAAAHPDYIAYFNELARGRPEQIRVDSDLDWGQSFDQLSRRIRERGIKEKIGLGIFGNVDLFKHGLSNAYIASPWIPSTGWLAIGATERYLSEATPPAATRQRPWSWLDRYQPVERIGRGAMLLYYIPPTSGSLQTTP